MEKREAPQMVYKGKTPQGYRVGIGINGAYGICPFCGKAYTEEDIKDSEKINFEHVYPRFAVKDAIRLVNRGDNKNKKSPEIESGIKVAVHKKCNSDGRELEDTIKMLVESVNKGGQLTPEQAKKVLQYCRKTRVFLRYLTDWENVPEAFAYDKEKKKNLYDVVLIGLCDDTNTLMYDTFKDFSIQIQNCVFQYKDCISQYKEVSDFMYYTSFLRVMMSQKGVCIAITNFDDSCICFKKEDEKPICSYIDKPVPWYLTDRLRFLHIYEYALNTLPNTKTTFLRDLEDNGFTGNLLLRKRLSLGGRYRPGIDDDLTFVQDRVVYVYENGQKYNIGEASPRKIYLLGGLGISVLPDLSKTSPDIFVCSRNKLRSLKGSPNQKAGEFDCSYNELTSLKYAPQKIYGDFLCNRNQLKSLKGAPKEISGSFRCDKNKLTSLEGAPKEIGGDFLCIGNALLTLNAGPEFVGGNFYCGGNKLRSLDGTPKRIGGNFSCDQNRLTSLKGGAEFVGGNFHCVFNKLTSLKYAPKKIDGNFRCTKNELTSLYGAPISVGGNFSCDQNKLTSLRGAPKKIGGSFSCNINKLSSLKGASQEVGGDFFCSGNKLKLFDCPNTVIGGKFLFDAQYLQSLDGLPQAKCYVVLDCDKEFNSADELRVWFEKYKKDRDGKKVAKGMRTGAKKVSAFSKALDAKNEIKPDNQKKK